MSRRVACQQLATFPRKLGELAIRIRLLDYSNPKSDAFFALHKFQTKVVETLNPPSKGNWALGRV